jgi:hypothetical protein
MNHKSTDNSSLNEGITASRYRGIKRAATITEIFARVRPQGRTPTSTRVHNILKPYLAKLETKIATSKEMKPLNLIILTDSIPLDNIKVVLLLATKKLNKLNVLLY